MFKIGKSCKKLIFGQVKHGKFSRWLTCNNRIDPPGGGGGGGGGGGHSFSEGDRSWGPLTLKSMVPKKGV